MNKKYLRLALPALALPLLTASALGQTTGVSHPDQTYDDTTVNPPTQTAPTQTDHYVMPARQASTDAAPQPAAVSEQPYPATSYPATGPAPSDATPAPTAALIVRQPLPATAPTQAASETYAPVQTATYTPEPIPASAAVGTDDGVVQLQLVPHQLNEGIVLKTRLDQAFSTETTVKGTQFSAQLLADLGHSGEILIPAGSVVHGTVTDIHGGRRISGMASIHLRADSVTLPDGLSYPLHATVSGIQSEEDQHVNSEGAIQPTTHPKETAIALGSVAGAATIMGAAIGGGVGAVVGATVGVGAGAIWWLKRDHQETLPAGTTLYFSLDEPFQVSPR